jgi:hypothetical protein
VSTEVPDAVGVILTLEGFSDVVIPVGADAERETAPEKPLLLVTVIVEFPEEPLATVMVDGLAERPKSPILMLPMNVDQQLPLPRWNDSQVPSTLLWYSPTTQRIVGSEGSSPAPK